MVFLQEAEEGGQRPLRALIRADPPGEARLRRAAHAVAPAHNGTAGYGRGARAAARRAARRARGGGRAPQPAADRHPPARCPRPGPAPGPPAPQQPLRAGDEGRGPAQQRQRHDSHRHACARRGRAARRERDRRAQGLPAARRGDWPLSTSPAPGGGSAPGQGDPAAAPPPARDRRPRPGPAQRPAATPSPGIPPGPRPVREALESVKGMAPRLLCQAAGRERYRDREPAAHARSGGTGLSPQHASGSARVRHRARGICAREEETAPRLFPSQ